MAAAPGIQQLLWKLLQYFHVSLSFSSTKSLPPLRKRRVISIKIRFPRFVLRLGLGLLAIEGCLGITRTSTPTTRMRSNSPRDQKTASPAICCAPPNPEIRKANSRLVFNSPVQIQTACAGDSCYTSAVDAIQPDVIPFALGEPFPDPDGIQIVTIMTQNEASLAEFGGNRDFVALWHIAGGENPFGNLTAYLERYLAFVSAGPFLPALAWTTYDSDPSQAILTSFILEGDVIALNRAAYFGENCVPELRPINSPRVPINPYFSHAVLSGRQIFTSLLTADNLTLSVADQTRRVLGYIESILAQEGQGLSSLIEVSVQLADASKQSEMDAVYAKFFADRGLTPPVRTLFMAAVFLVPGQVGAAVGIRATALKVYDHCPHQSNLVNFYNVPEVFHESTTLSSVGAQANGYIYFGGVFGTILPPGGSTPPSEPESLSATYYRAMQNMLYVVARKGSNLPDLIDLWTSFVQGLEGYNQLAGGLANIYNSTSYLVPAVTFDVGGINPFGFRYQLSGIFYNADFFNYEAFPSPYPWEINAQLLADVFGPGNYTNNHYCSSSSLATCAKPGFFYSNYPLQPGQSLGSQPMRSNDLL